MDAQKFRQILAFVRDLIAGTEWEGRVFAVGGCVRDEIMGLPIKDVDMVVDLPDGGTRFAQWLFDQGVVKGSVVKYESFGTAMLKLLAFPEDELEFVQSRKEKYPDRRSRNPVVAFGTIEDDSFRRDLTINSLDINISTGELLDVTGHGVDDIRNHVLRTPLDPDETFDDDPLRILRAIRFSSRFGWKIDDRTFKGMVRMAPRIEIITVERIQDEFSKMLLSDRPVMAMELLMKSGAMRFVFPELEQTVDLAQNGYHFGTVWEHTLAVLDKVQEKDLILRLAALLHDVGKLQTRSMSEDGKVQFIGHEKAGADLAAQMLLRLKLPTAVIKEVSFLIGKHMLSKQWGDSLEKMKDKRLRELQLECATEERFERLVSLIDADNRSHADGFCLPGQAQAFRSRTAAMKQEGTALFGYKLPVTGKDVMELKGLKPGPEVKEVLEYVLKLAFVQPVRSRDEWVKHVIGFKLNK